MAFRVLLKRNLLLQVFTCYVVVTETLGSFARVNDTTATNKMTTVQKNTSIDNTTHFSDNNFDITRTKTLSTDVHQSNTESDVNTLLKNDSRKFDLQSNATRSATVGPLGNATVLSVKKDFWQKTLSEELIVYVSPFLIIFGTLGNGVSIITLQHRHFRYTSTGFILTALSAVDIVVLNASLLSDWLWLVFGMRFEDLSSIGCKLYSFLRYYPHSLAPWTLILLTVQRGISVWYPLRCKELCSKRRIVIAWVIIATLLFAENSLFFRAYGLRPLLHLEDNNMSTVRYTCRPVDDYWHHFVKRKWSIVEAVISNFFPFVVILTGNILIITRIIKSHYEHKAQMGAASTSKSMTSTTVKLIGLSAMYLVLKGPYDVTYFLYLNTEWGSLQEKDEWKAIYNLALCISILSYSSNNAFEFIVYFLYIGGRKFRKAFLETFLSCSKSNNRNGQRASERRSKATETPSSVMGLNATFS